MGIEKILGYGLVYLAFLFLFTLVGLDVYKSSLRHTEQMDTNVKNHAQNIAQAEALARALEANRETMMETVAALAAQKSLVLITDESGGWKLVALDTGNRDRIRAFLDQQRRDAEAAAEKNEN